MPSSSLVSTMAPTVAAAAAEATAYSTSGAPPTIALFLPGTPFDPARTGTTASNPVVVSLPLRFDIVTLLLMSHTHSHSAATTVT